MHCGGSETPRPEPTMAPVHAIADTAARAAPAGGGGPMAGSPPPGWLDRNCPPQLLPYAQLMRLDKPIGEIAISACR